MATSAYDYLIVGAGLTGSVIARELTDAGARCLVIDKRDHIGGNVYDEIVGGIRVHRYGPHIFHTNSRRIWKYVHRFSDWDFYEHRVRAYHDGKMYSFPPNLLTYQQLGINADDPALLRTVYDTFFRGYSMKQWDRDFDDVPKSVIKRIPIRFDYDDRYFSDRYQGLPSGGYSAMIASMLAGIDCQLGSDFFAAQNEFERLAAKVVYTGPIDRYYDYRFWRLEYRSLEFYAHLLDVPVYQGVASVNHTGLDVDYTRIHEWRYFGWQRTAKTVITKEYPVAYNGKNIPYYPVSDERNKRIYRKYSELAERDGLIVAGRLGRYRYYNMDQAIAAALVLVKRLLCH